jgi:regulator of sigma E protease
MEALRGLIEWAPLGLPAWLFMITVIVFIHELGHFSVARACGVKIETFSIGFGRAIASWHDRHGTRWKIGWLPIGGYVKFFGDLDASSQPDREHVESLPEEERKLTLQAKPLWQRAAIVAAGPVANFLLAFVVLTGLYAIAGERVIATQIKAVTPNSPAAEAGLRPGDKIVALDGHKVTYFAELHPTLEHGKGRALPITLERAGRQVNLTVRPRSFVTKDLLGTPTTIVGIGIEPDVENPANLISVPIPLWEAPVDAAAQCWAITDLSLTYVWRIFAGRADTTQMSGTLGMAKAAKSAASHGPFEFISLIALISVSLGLINLFPIPVLDGGHLLYYGCEAILGRPLGERVQEAGFRVGLVVVLGLMIFSVWNDLAHHLNLF